ncbi:MAG: hypothetical protein K9N51_06385 [Candidatus Pacebacteria bacterium]|nr:hypothetical protein [Candidatus Paceibacterota bacterium]
MTALILLSGCVMQPGKVLLDGPAVAGYTQEGPVKVYTENTLFDYINGEAEVYFARGFQRLYVLTYRNDASGDLYTVDAYDLGSSDQVRETHEYFKGRHSRPIDGLANATTDGLTVHLPQGSFFVRIQATQDVAEPSEEELVGLAKAVHGVL